MTICEFFGGPHDGKRMAVSETQHHVIVPEKIEMVATTWNDIGEVDVSARAFPRHLYTRSQVLRDRFIYQGLEGQAKQEITWTQYLLPDGRRTQFQMEVPPDVADKAKRLEARGLWLEAEVLRTGDVSLTIADREEGMDADIRVIANGPAVQEAACDMIRRFDLEGYSA